MKYITVLLFVVIVGCTTAPDSTKPFKKEFTVEEQIILSEAKKLIASAYYTTLITQDKKHQPRARVVEPFFPEEDYTIWMATNPKSRKVQQLKHNSKTTLHYFDKNRLGYVSLMGDAFLVDDLTTKKQIWKEGWEKFYPKREQDFILIKFIPHTLELISPGEELLGDKKTWKPHQVILRE